MKKYEMPRIVVNEGVAEGVFMDSGAHYNTITWSSPVYVENGYYDITISAKHNLDAWVKKQYNHQRNVSFQLTFSAGPVSFDTTYGQWAQGSATPTSFSFNNVYLSSDDATSITTTVRVYSPDGIPQLLSVGVSD